MITDYGISFPPTIYTLNWLISCLALIVRLAWLLDPAKGAKGMSWPVSAASVVSSSETLFCTDLRSHYFVLHLNYGLRDLADFHRI